MDIQSLGLDERLVSAASGSGSRGILHEKMLEHAVGRAENVLAKIEVSSGREEISLLPALHWLLSAAEGERRRVLVATADRAAAESIASALRRLGSTLPSQAGGEIGGSAALGLSPCLVTPAEESEGGAGAAAVLEGDPGSAFLVGLPSSLLSAAESGLFNLKDFGFLLVEGGERLAELAPELLKAFSAALLPSWERRCIVACSKISVKAKNLAWELADNPVEIHVEEEAAKAQNVAQESWQLADDMKLRFLLGLLARSAPPRLAVFCNLKSSAEELALRLSHNGVPSDYILGALPLERKAAILDKLKAGESRILVLTDQGAEGLATASFPLLVNYEIPLEPELYMKRLELLDGEAAEAKVVNLVCDRYAVGLPAIESYIDASLEARPVTAALLAAEDLSSAFVYERPHSDRGRGDSRRGGSRGAGGRAGRLVPPPRPSSPDRSGEPRREAGRSDSRRGREGGRQADEREREDRRPEIWRSIAEATGGDFGRESAASGKPPRALADREPEAERAPNRGGKKRESSGSQGRAGRPSAQNKAAKSSRESERPGRKAAERKDGLPNRGRGKVAGGPSAVGKAPSGGAGGETRSAGNPYELSMEERMRRYREKYGTRLDAEKKGGRAKGQGQGRARPSGGEPGSPPPGEGNRGQTGRAAQGRAAAQGSSAASGRGPGAGRGGPDRARAAAPGQARGSRADRGRGGENPVSGSSPSPNPSRQPRPASPPKSAPTPDTSAPKPGVLGKLLGMFKKKSE